MLRLKGRVFRNMWLYCPFCQSDYIATTEQRSHVKCPYCHGNGWEAETLRTQIDHFIDTIKDQSVEDIHVLILNLGSGYYRSELRSYLRRNNLAQPDPAVWNVGYIFFDIDEV